MNFAIMQGRLSPPVKGHIQEFPDNWKKEFDMSMYGTDARIKNQEALAISHER